MPALARLRYTSPHPRHLTPSLIQAHAEVPVLARHVHMPVQSGSDRVLKRMIRRYSRAEYVERVATLARAVPGVTLSTDIIVGFPGETEEDFAQTLSLVEEIGFKGLFGFKYSERPYTPARKLGDDIPEAVKSERLARLFALSEALLGEHLAGLVGTTAQVLVEGIDKESGALWSGRTERNEIVHIARRRRSRARRRGGLGARGRAQQALPPGRAHRRRARRDGTAGAAAQGRAPIAPPPPHLPGDRLTWR